METEALEDVVKIRIALVPVGEMSPEKFDQYVEIFSQFVSLDFRNFSYGDGNKKKKLKYRDIRNDKIQFDFIRLEWAITNDWEDLFAHRRILGAIGIADCKQWDNILLAAEEFSRIIQEPKVMGNIIARLCLAVEPGEHQQDLDHETIKISNSKSTEKIVMVPNQDRVHTNHYFSTLFLEFSLKIIKEIEERIGSEVVMLQTPQDKNSVIVDSNKKIKNARFSKYQGDLCLLLGSPKDASEYYTACLEGIKTVPSENLWLASVYEGLACVKLIDVLERYAYNLVDVSVAETDAYAVERKNTIDQATVEITKYLEDAIDIYGKKRLYLLKLETMIKLTRFLLLKNNKIAASQTIMSAYAQSDSLTVQQKISLCSSMAIIYRDIGMIRKFSFFLRETAELCKSITLFRRSYGLLKLIAPYYHVQVAPDDAIEAPIYQNNNRNTYSGNNPLIISSQVAKTGSKPMLKKTRREHLLENGKDWIDIQSSIYDSLIEVAAMLRDPSYPVSYLITYLSNIGPFLPPEKQKAISDSLASYTRKLPSLSSPFCKGMLKLVCNSVQEKNKDGKLIELELDDARLLRSGPFLYKPKAKVQVNAMDTPVAHVSVRVPYVLRMQVENPLDLPLTLKNLELRTDALEIKSEVLSEIVLPPLSKKKLDIAVTCFEEGLLKEVELSYYAFNCQLTQAIKMELHVRFIQELSVLSVTSAKLNGSALSLFPGQYSSFELLFKNLGDEVIDFLHFNVIESTTVKDDDPMGILFPQPKSLSWDQSIIDKAAPMKPGQSFVLPITMLVRETCSGVKFDIKYGQMDTVKDWQRHLEIPLAFNVVGGLNITKFDIHECSTESLQRYHDLPPHRFFFTENTKEETHCLALLEIKNVTTQPFYLEVNKDPASKIDFARDSSVFFTSESFITIEPISMKRIFVALPRMAYSFADLPSIEPALRKYLTKEMNLTPEEFNNFRMAQLYRTKMLDQISINWHSVSHNTHGKLLLETVQIPEPTLIRLKAKDLRIAMEVLKSEKVLSPGVVQVPINQMTQIKVTVALQNENPESEVKPLFLSLAVPVINVQSFSWVGVLNNVPLSELRPNESISRVFTVCFHERGSFNVLACCRDAEKSNWSNDLEIVVN